MKLLLKENTKSIVWFFLYLINVTINVTNKKKISIKSEHATKTFRVDQGYTKTSVDKIKQLHRQMRNALFST